VGVCRFWCIEVVIEDDWTWALWVVDDLTDIVDYFLRRRRTFSSQYYHQYRLCDPTLNANCKNVIEQRASKHDGLAEPSFLTSLHPQKSGRTPHLSYLRLDLDIHSIDTRNRQAKISIKSCLRIHQTHLDRHHVSITHSSEDKRTHMLQKNSRDKK